jgi:hypothetical protein
MKNKWLLVLLFIIFYLPAGVGWCPDGHTRRAGGEFRINYDAVYK